MAGAAAKAESPEADARTPELPRAPSRLELAARSMLRAPRGAAEPGQRGQTASSSEDEDEDEEDYRRGGYHPGH